MDERFYDLDEDGIYSPQIEVDLSDPDAIAQSLRRHLTLEQVAELRALLDEP